MEPIGWTSIILAVISLISGCGWFVNRRKYRLDLSTEFACKFRELIARPLEDEVVKLRTEVNQLRDAIQRIGDCPHSGSCPVRDELQRQSQSD